MEWILAVCHSQPRTHLKHPSLRACEDSNAVGGINPSDLHRVALRATNFVLPVLLGIELRLDSALWIGLSTPVFIVSGTLYYSQ